jgi:hypothetical protein
MSRVSVDRTRLSPDDQVTHDHAGPVIARWDEAVGEVHGGISHGGMLDRDGVGDGVGEAEVHPGFRVDEGGKPAGGLQELVGHQLARGTARDEQGQQRGGEGEAGPLERAV